MTSVWSNSGGRNSLARRCSPVDMGMDTCCTTGKARDEARVAMEDWESRTDKWLVVFRDIRW